MSSNIVQIKPCADPSTALRNIAEGIDRGDFAGGDWTIIGGGQVFHCGQVDDARAAESAIFNMTMGIHKLMHPVVSEG